MIYRFIIFIAIAAAFLSCSKKKSGKNSESKLTFISNMDCIDCWSNTGTLKPGIAHSGQYASKLDANTEYSYAFAQPYNVISQNKVSKVNVKIWGYFPSTDIKAQLIITVDSISKSRLWVDSKLEDKIKTANTWTEVNFSAVLPAKIADSDIIKVYVWNPTKRTFYVDDMEVSFE